MKSMRVNLIAAISVTFFFVAACGAERSTEAFCETLSSEKQRILEQFEVASQPKSGDQFLELIGGLGASVQALGELRTYFDKLADVAPEEIRSEAEILSDHFDKQFDDAEDVGSNPFGQLAGSLVGAMAVSGPMNTVQQFAMTHCEEGI
jgi:hypothetical protein